jgi:hypothetical protein
MKRKRRSENVSDFLYADDAELRMLRSQLARWATDRVEELSRARPTLPDGFENRLACTWRPLFAIANLCGGRLVPAHAFRNGIQTARNMARHVCGRVRRCQER